ncbi:hypothetical protein KKD72_02230 [Patescibacteria group bacterium]|nr:hypothetical protein [Patescibacteria group bacterium]
MTELLVVMFILSLLSSTVLVGYRSGQKRYSLYQTAQRLASDIRRVQNMAISGVNITGNYYGYGVYAVVGETSYLIYGDTNNSFDYQPTDSVIETVYLPDRIRIKETFPNSGKTDVFFKPPQPQTFVNGSSLAGSIATITSEIIGDSLTKSVIVTTAGLIEVK